jgi:DNA anti-recombination protein RmuC
MGTKFDVEAIKKSAESIGKLMEDTSAFDALKNHWPNAGKFQLAVWLERLVDDRRNAIVAHAEHLKLAFETMEDKLTSIANDFENADGDNADKISSSMSELEGDVIDAVNSFDTTTESEQHNYTHDDEATSPHANDPHDSDGYNDNLNDQVTT